MRIEHVGLWTNRLEALREFYVRYFGARPGAPYRNPRRGFESCFLSFDSGARLELMRMPEVVDPSRTPDRAVAGYQHVALTVGSEAEVDALTARLRDEGHRVLGGPRRTGDGCYESVVLDPDQNRVEIAAEGAPGERR
jgi:lactoylglutathione lyase